MVFWFFCLEGVKVFSVCHTLPSLIFLKSVTVSYTLFQLLCLNYDFGEEEEQEEEERLTAKTKVLGSRTHVLLMNFAILFSVMKANKCAYRHNKSRWSLHQVWSLETEYFWHFTDVVWRINKRRMGFFSTLILILYSRKTLINSFSTVIFCRYKSRNFRFSNNKHVTTRVFS